MRHLLFIILFLLLFQTAQGWQQKPMLGEQINWGHDLSHGLVGCWLFNEKPGELGTVYDLSNYGNYGSIFADCHSVPGKFGPALDFDGTGDFVGCPIGLIVEGNPVTISAWVNLRSMPDETIYTIVAMGEAGAAADVIRISVVRWDSTTADYFFAQQYDGVDVGDAISTTLATTSVGNWVHVVGVFLNDSYRTIYINGIAENTNTTAITALDSQDYTDIGRLNWDGGPTQYMNGQIDHAMIWNRALTSSEVSLLYHEPFCMFADENVVLINKVVQVGGQVIIIAGMIFPLLFIYKILRDGNA